MENFHKFRHLVHGAMHLRVQLDRLDPRSLCVFESGVPLSLQPGVELLEELPLCRRVNAFGLGVAQGIGLPAVHDFDDLVLQGLILRVKVTNPVGEASDDDSREPPLRKKGERVHGTGSYQPPGSAVSL